MHGKRAVFWLQDPTTS